MATVSRTYPRARKDCRCSSCNRLICKGERYHRWTGRGDEWFGLATMKECSECCDRYGRPLPEEAP